MAELKTKKTDSSVAAYLNAVTDEQQRKDAKTVCKLMQEITGEKPKMWGAAMVGFGDYHYKSERTGRGGDWFITGFSPRKQNLSLHLMSGFERFETLMNKLGKYKTGKGCLYIKKLEDVDMNVLKELITQSVAYMKSLKK